MTLGIRIVDKREGDSRSHNARRVGTKVHGTADVRSPPRLSMEVFSLPSPQRQKAHLSLFQSRLRASFEAGRLDSCCCCTLVVDPDVLKLEEIVSKLVFIRK